MIPGLGSTGVFVSDHEAEECALLRRRLTEQRANAARLRTQIAEEQAECEAAHTAASAALSVARLHSDQMRQELAACHRRLADHEAARNAFVGPSEAARNLHSDGGEDFVSPMPSDRSSRASLGFQESNSEIMSEGNKVTQRDLTAETLERALLMEVRQLRLDLNQCKHEVESLEAGRPSQEAQITQSKANLTHVRDVLESTQYQVKHYEIETGYGTRLSSQEQQPGPDRSGQQPHVGHGSIQIAAERGVREKVEDKNGSLTDSTQRLTCLVAAQQLQIQRLEKQLLRMGKCAEHKSMQLQMASRDAQDAKRELRLQSDAAVAQSLGIPAAYQTAASMRRGIRLPGSRLNRSASHGSASPLLPLEPSQIDSVTGSVKGAHGIYKP